MPGDMPIHGLRYDVHLTAIDDVDLVQAALKWLAGPEGVVLLEKGSTHHGGRFHKMRVVFEKSGPARRALARLGPLLLEELGRTAQNRIDEDKRLHFRLDLGSLVCGDVCIGSEGPVVKGRLKLRVQPGEEILAVADKLIFAAVKRAARSSWPPPFEDDTT